MPSATKSFYETVNAAIADVAKNGFDSQERVDFWLREIAEAADRDATPERIMRETLEGALRAIYSRLVERGDLFKRHPGVSRFTVDKLRPQLRADLARRIAASADLIRMNRQEAIRKTLHRFSGWATSVPKGGSRATDKAEAAKDVKKSLKQLPFADRRVLIDQGHKFVSSLNDVIAKDGGAIGGIWHSNWRRLNYNYREDHKERDELIYLIRDSWAHERGFVKAINGFIDQIDQPAEKPFCSCFFEYVYDLRALPSAMLTAKGLREIQFVKVA